MQYQYALNNPLKYVDPTGKWSVDCIVNLLDGTQVRNGKRVVAGNGDDNVRVLQKALKYLGHKVGVDGGYYTETLVAYQQYIVNLGISMLNDRQIDQQLAMEGTVYKQVWTTIMKDVYRKHSGINDYYFNPYLCMEDQGNQDEFLRIIGHYLHTVEPQPSQENIWANDPVAKRFSALGFSLRSESKVIYESGPFEKTLGIYYKVTYRVSITKPGTSPLTIANDSILVKFDDLQARLTNEYNVVISYNLAKSNDEWAVFAGCKWTLFTEYFHSSAVYSPIGGGFALSVELNMRIEHWYELAISAAAIAAVLLAVTGLPGWESLEQLLEQLVYS